VLPSTWATSLPVRRAIARRHRGVRSPSASPADLAELVIDERLLDRDHAVVEPAAADLHDRLQLVADSPG
jgi:hypothetical protein